jgi:hypothetical protein
MRKTRLTHRPVGCRVHFQGTSLSQGKIQHTHFNPVSPGFWESALVCPRCPGDQVGAGCERQNVAPGRPPYTVSLMHGRRYSDWLEAVGHLGQDCAG